MSEDLPLEMEVSVGEVAMQFRRMLDRGQVGEFWRGSRGIKDSEEPRHRVRLTKPYYLGVTPVTQREYRAMVIECVERLSNFKNNKYKGGIEPSFFKGDELPVERVAWVDVDVICEWLSESGLLPQGWKAALPSETQWEYGCRAGTETEFWSGDGEAMLAEVGWYEGNTRKTQSVKRLPANPWGLYDMHGNVWELCRSDSNKIKGFRDCLDPVTEPKSTYIVNRGGAWFGAPAESCRSSARSCMIGLDIGGIIGFRLCLLPGPVAASPESGAEAGGVRRGTSRKPESHGGASEIDLRAEQGPRPDDPA